MANNSTGSKPHGLNSEDPALLPNGNPSKLDSTIEAILRKKVCEFGWALSLASIAKCSLAEVKLCLPL